jgi:hypothetical protein
LRTNLHSQDKESFSRSFHRQPTVVDGAIITDSRFRFLKIAKWILAVPDTIIAWPWISAALDRHASLFSRSVVSFYSRSLMEAIGEACLSPCKFVNSVHFDCRQSLGTEIPIPASIEIPCEGGFLLTASLESIMFDRHGQFKITDSQAFKSIALSVAQIPPSIDIIGSVSFCPCTRLETVTLEADLRIMRIEASTVLVSVFVAICVPSLK